MKSLDGGQLMCAGVFRRSIERGGRKARGRRYTGIGLVCAARVQLAPTPPGHNRDVRAEQTLGRTIHRLDDEAILPAVEHDAVEQPDVGPNAQLPPQRAETLRLPHRDLAHQVMVFVDRSEELIIVPVLVADVEHARQASHADDHLPAGLAPEPVARPRAEPWIIVRTEYRLAHAMQPL